MNLEQTITIIFSSSLLSSALTGFVTWLIKRNDYKKEYYKEIIKKRMFCYEQIEHFLGAFSLVILDDNGKDKYYNCLANPDTYMRVFITDIGISLKFSMWINNDTCKLLNRFNEFALEYNDKIIGENIDKKELIKAAIVAYPIIQRLRDELKQSVISDLKNLHKLEFSKFEN